VESRATWFRDWLSDVAGYRHLSDARAITPPQAIALLRAYLDYKAIQILPGSGNPPHADTLCHYLTAAYSFLQPLVVHPFDIYVLEGHKHRVLHPILHDIITQRRKWQQPMQKRQPYTRAMFTTFHRMVQTATNGRNDRHLDRLACIFNWLCLGVFTGSRACEYAQTAAPKGTFATIPDEFTAGDWRGLPIAFIRGDFTFLDEGRLVIDHVTALKQPTTVSRLRLRYRFDKSGRNFTEKEYARGAGFLCPIEAALSIIRRARILRVPPREPIGVYRTTTAGAYTFLRSNEIIAMVRKICIATYPDPTHFLRINIKCLVAHSNRVTAAVALRRAGWDNNAIAHRLRWRPESVDHYLRELHSDIDALTAAAIHGALHI
jgi:hypothetical protein